MNNITTRILRGKWQLAGRRVRTKVIDHVTHGQQIQGGKQVSSISRGIVVIAVNTKDGQINGKIGVLIIDDTTPNGFTGIRRDLQSYGARSAAVATHNFHGLVQCPPTGPVFVKQVAG